MGQFVVINQKQIGGICCIIIAAVIKCDGELIKIPWNEYIIKKNQTTYCLKYLNMIFPKCFWSSGLPQTGARFNFNEALMNFFVPFNINVVRWCRDSSFFGSCRSWCFNGLSVAGLATSDSPAKILCAHIIFRVLSIRYIYFCCECELTCSQKIYAEFMANRER